MTRRVLTLIRKEFIELLHMPRLLGLVIVAPVLQLGLLGYAATTDIRDVPVAIVDADHSPRSRALVERFSASRYFRIVDEAASADEVDGDLARGRAWLAIVIPAGFADALEGKGPAGGATIQMLADGTDSNSSGVALAYAAGLVGDYNASINLERGTPGSALEGRVRVWYNPELQSKDFMVPGVIALLLLAVTTNLSAMAIVREREIGTLEQLNVTPIGRWELILGKFLPYALVGFLDVLLVMTVAVLWFGVPLRGSVTLLLLSSFVYLLCTLGLGLFVSTISSTQQQAMMTATFFFLMPMIYLSGFVFPIENMPGAIQSLTYVIPLRYFLVIVRGIFLKGVGLSVLWRDMAALFAWGATVMLLAAARAKKRA